MSFSPSGTLYLLGNVPLDNTYKNVINFNNADDQVNYFKGKIQQQLDNYTFIRKDLTIKVAVNVETLYNVNYVMYRNYLTSKWIFAFVTEMKYINESNTELVIETDVYQTWLFDAQLLKSFVIREHVADDTIFSHITDEGLDTGEYVRAAATTSGKLDGYKIMVAMSYDSTVNNNLGEMNAGIYSALSYLPYDTSSDGVASLNQFIKDLASAGKSSMIAAIFMMPTDFIGNDPYFPVDYDITPSARPTNFQGYTPKNNKLYCYPYSLLYVSSNQGMGATFRYEFMGTPDTPQFKIAGELNPSPTIYLMPMNYKGLPTNADERLTLNNFPLCSWNNDVFSNWLAQNRNKLLTSGLTSLFATASGVATDNPMIMTAGVYGITNQLSEAMDRAIQPAQAMGNLAGSGAMSVGLQDFFFYPTTITKEYAERIDNFFDMFGYKVNTVKIPNTSGRPYWNYVKTIDVNITGKIPMKDLTRIKQIYNEGVTIWHGDFVGNYSLNNH